MPPFPHLYDKDGEVDARLKHSAVWLTVSAPVTVSSVLIFTIPPVPVLSVPRPAPGSASPTKRLLPAPVSRERAAPQPLTVAHTRDECFVAAFKVARGAMCSVALSPFCPRRRVEP